MSTVLRVCAFLAAVGFLYTQQTGAAPEHPTTYGQTGEQAVNTLLNVYYTGDGFWRDCAAEDCSRANGDWGDDSATYSLYLRWKTTRDGDVSGVMRSLLSTARAYPAPCTASPCAAWSDTPAWDAVAFMREYVVLDGDPQALSMAEAALAYVDDSQAFSGGACPELPYQQPQPSTHHVKTLETDANAIKAALLIYRATGDRAYLYDAQTRYNADRAFYLDAAADLYSVHVIDNGTSCVQVPRRFFASVNGDMIWNGLELWRDTGDEAYRDQAIATAKAVDTNLSDARGVFADLQGENDVVEPLVEAMYDLAADQDEDLAREWILRNAAAALAGRADDGTFSRFFDGPRQPGASVWEANGGLALQIAASALAPRAEVSAVRAWSGGHYLGAPITTLPATISFDGSGIALIGTISEACQRDHVRVFIDGQETFDRTGLWQNASMPKGDSVLFAWRWPAPGHHVIQLEPGDPSQAGHPVADMRTLLLGD